MLSQSLVISLSVSGLLAGVSAHFNNPHHARYAHPNPTAANLFVERGDPYPTTGPEYAIPALSSIVPTPADYSADTLTVKTTYTEGTQPSLAGAPSLPAPTVNQATYPEPDQLAPTNTTDVQTWIDAIDWTQIPDIPVNKARDCSDPQVATAVADGGPDKNCWWTCGGCTRDVDITTCANQWEYGHGYDDGPGLYTNKLLTYLESRDLKATFYLVGSRVYYRPEIVRYEYMTGHELSVHTWSHGGENQIGLTMMTNEQIVAELGYTKKIIHEVTGVTPLTMRPPFGDIDDRVRAISLAMGLMPVIWTSVPNPVAGQPQIQWDSQDWRVHAPADQGGVPAVSNQQAFQTILDSSSQFTDHGVIALQHDIYVEAVNLAIGYTLPYLLDQHQPPFSLKPIMQCQGRPDGDMYAETNQNHDSPAVSGSGDVATRTSNLGYAAHNSDQVSVPASRTYETSMGSGTGTHTSSNSNTTGGAVNMKAAGGLVSLLFGSVVGGVMLL